MTANAWDAQQYKKAQAAASAAGYDPYQYTRSKLGQNNTLAQVLDAGTNGVSKSKDLVDTGVYKEPVIIGLDVTGSYSSVPPIIRDDLPQLMGMITTTNPNIYPDLMFGFIGDFRSDSCPMQFSRFESDAVKIDEILTNAVLEGGGGGQKSESYTEFLWGVINHTEIDALSRGVKPIVVLVADELPYDYAYARYVNDFYNPTEKLLRDVSLETIMNELKRNFEPYYIMCKGTMYWDDDGIVNTWKKYLGNEKVIRLNNPEDISEVIGSLVLYRQTRSISAVQYALEQIGESRLVDFMTKTLAVTPTSSMQQSSSLKVRRIQRN